MNGHDRRRQRIIGRIKKSALELFTTFGVEMVTMDEIAAKADVSKVTIYKYFHSKEALYGEVISLYVDEILAATEKLLDSDLNVIEKLKIIMLAQANSPKVAGGEALFELWEKDGQTGEGGQGGLKNRIRDIMFRVYEQGKKEGYIEENLSFELLNLYAEIFQAGFKAKLVDLETVLSNPETFEQLLHYFFFGIIRRE